MWVAVLLALWLTLGVVVCVGWWAAKTYVQQAYGWDDDGHEERGGGTPSYRDAEALWFDAGEGRDG